MEETEPDERGGLTDDHLYVCRYGDQQTISTGEDVGLWNEGLSGQLAVERDLGRIVHSWVVTEAGVRTVRHDHVTDRGTFVMIPTADGGQRLPRLLENAETTVRFPSELMTAGQVRTAVRSTEPAEVAADPAELDRLGDDARAVAAAINDGIEEAFEARYEAWRAELESYPQGRDFGYEVPLEADWKRRAIERRVDLSRPTVDVLASAGFPASMRVAVDVDVPEAPE